MTEFISGNAIDLLRSGKEYFPALIEAIAGARREVWLEAYLFADDDSGWAVAHALIDAAKRGAEVRVLVDGWGARHYLTRNLEQALTDGGVQVLKYRPDIAPWNFRSNRLRRLHRKLCHVDARVGFVGGINIIDDMHTPRHKPPRVDFAVRVRGPVLAEIARTMQRVWAIVEISQLRSSDVRLFPDTVAAEPAGDQVAAFAIRDNLRHRNDIELAYLSAIEGARHEILIATAYFFPSAIFRHALLQAAARGVRVTLLLQARVEYRLLHWASRALYGQLLVGNVTINEYHRSFLHAKVAVVDNHWATVGSSNIDPYSFLMAREANLFVRDAGFAGQLRRELVAMVDAGSRPVPREKWANRSRIAKAISWIAYGVVRVSMGVLRYGGDEWWKSA
jgi:cardiolipin synthase A/B